MRRLLSVLSVCAAAFVIWKWSSSQAHACELAQQTSLVTVEDPTDDEPPSAPEVNIFEIDRGENNRPEACAPGVESSCDDVATLEVAVSARDDTSDPDQLGYVIEVVGDDPGLDPGPDPLLAGDGRVRLHWSGDDGTEDLSFTLKVWAVDRTGKRSAVATTVDVESEGTRGCRLARASHEGVSWLGLLFALLASRSSRLRHRARLRQ